MKCLIIVDVQNDFLPGGRLEVKNGDSIIPGINGLLKEYSQDLVIFTMDFHPLNHKSFASQHKDKKPFDVIELNGMDQVLWPDHCIQGSYGVRIHEDVDPSMCKNVYIFKKGTDIEVDSYSGFYDNGGKNSTGLAEFLSERGIKDVLICGLALDYCVKYTALDAVSEGLNTSVYLSCTKSIDEDIKPHLGEMQEKGITIIN